mmetsp:Transcript_40921/g.65789  ORF Transcript_40921/g.65789 Transcript_40921/m.65789 type:complete len:250 (-) Transcript_40921:183-932(-)
MYSITDEKTKSEIYTDCLLCSILNKDSTTVVRCETCAGGQKVYRAAKLTTPNAERKNASFHHVEEKHKSTRDHTSLKSMETSKYLPVSIPGFDLRSPSYSVTRAAFSPTHGISDEETVKQESPSTTTLSSPKYSKSPFIPTSPSYYMTSPNHVNSPTYVPTSPQFVPTSPEFTAQRKIGDIIQPEFQPSIKPTKQYAATSPHSPQCSNKSRYIPTSPCYATSPSYIPISPKFMPISPISSPSPLSRSPA